MNNAMPLSFQVKSSKKNEFGKAPIYARITINEVDDWYIKGLKSKGYKFTAKYSRGIKIIQVVDRCRINAIKKESKFAASIQKKYNHLIKWYGSNLQIDYDLATKIHRR
jgi:hypothetical protein